MIIKVEKKNEASILEYICALWGFQFNLFTIENNDLLTQAEILHADGRDLDAETGWLLAKSVDVKLERLQLTK
jgi:hypothetical protein